MLTFILLYFYQYFVPPAHQKKVYVNEKNNKWLTTA